MVFCFLCCGAYVVPGKWMQENYTLSRAFSELWPEVGDGVKG